MPNRERAVDARHRLDSKLSGANPIDALVEIPKGQSLYSPETLATIAEVQSILESQAGIGNVWSLETLRRWLAKAARGSDVSTVKQYVSLFPEALVRRFISADQTAVVITGRVADLDASQLLPIVDSLNKA